MANPGLADLALDHLLLHFSDMPALRDEGLTVIERGEGCHVFDTDGKRWIDGLSGLYCSNLGHSHGTELGAAAREQLERIAYTPSWNLAHPGTIELAAKIAELAPAGLNRTFFTSGGSESVEAAYKLARQLHAARGEPQRVKVIARRDAYHGVTLGALAMTGMPGCRAAFEPPAIPVRHVAATNAYRHPDGADPARFRDALLAEIEDVIAFEGAGTIAMLIAEPVQNAGGCFVAPPGYWQGLRALCDRHGILLCSDEVICAWGRLGAWFGAERFDYVPDLLTFAKGITSGAFAFGGVLMHDRVAEPFLDGRADYAHGMTFGGHPVGSALALATIGILEREDVVAHVRANAAGVRERMDSLRDAPFVGDVRGDGYFCAIELVRDKDTREPFSAAEAHHLLKEVVSARMDERGLLCRLDDRADPVIQLSPPLVAGLDLWDEITEIVADALAYAAARPLP